MLELTPRTGRPVRHAQGPGIIGEGVDLTPRASAATCGPPRSAIHLTQHLLYTKWRDPGEEPKLHLFGQLKRIAKQWLDSLSGLQGRHLSGAAHVSASWPTWPASASRPPSPGTLLGERPIKAMLDPYNPTGSTAHVNFNTSKTDRWTDRSAPMPRQWVVLDSDWEAEFCRVAEAHPQGARLRQEPEPRPRSALPLRLARPRKYCPDFIVLVDDGHGADDLLNLMVEIKGYRGEDAKEKKSTMETYWVPGVNNLGTYGRWAFAEFTDVYEIEADFKAKVEARVQQADRAATAQRDRARRRRPWPRNPAKTTEDSRGLQAR